MKRLIGLGIVGMITGLVWADTSSAELIYGYATDAATYEATPGGSTEVVVYLEELLTEGSSSGLVANNGLFSFDVVLETVAAPSAPALVTVAAANPDFNGMVNNVPPVMLIADRDLLELEGVQPVAISPDTYRILLGTFSVEAGGVLGQTTTFSVQDFENPITPGTDHNTFYWDDILAETPLDPLLIPASFSVTVVPEPGILLLILTGVPMLCFVFRRRFLSGIHPRVMDRSEHRSESGSVPPASVSFGHTPILKDASMAATGSPRRCGRLAAYLAVLVLMVAARQAACETVLGGFDLARGGEGSLRDGEFFERLRPDITSGFAPATFSSTNTLTDAYLSTIDVLILDAVWSGSGPAQVNPLSPDEQMALRGFVESGGGAVLLTDAETAFEAANESFLDPFGLDSTGYLEFDQTLTITDPSHPVADGPFGTVTSVDYWFSAYFNNLGPDAVQVGTVDGRPGLAAIAPGQLEPGSGGVVFFSDHSPGRNNSTVMLNSIAFVISDAVIPEPSTLVLLFSLALAGAGVGYQRKRKTA